MSSSRMGWKRATLALSVVMLGGATLAMAEVSGRAGARAAARPVTVMSGADTVRDTVAGKSAVPAVTGLRLRFLDSLAGASGKLRARFIPQSRPSSFAMLERIFNDAVGTRPGVYAVDSIAGRPFAFITMRPFSDKVRGRVGSYWMGSWPFEGRTPRSAAYANPAGFIEVTPQNQDTYVSEHFRLRDFLTHDQQNVWPKYLVLDEQLIDKLELVIAELQREGVPVRRMVVMSGFRTPQYNRQGVGAGGRASSSRHQYGDAADVFVDNDGDGWTDDVNGDGRVDVRDAELVRRAAERVERAHPELIGGIGVYRATSAHGPFTHIDARGYRARWGVEG